MTQNQIIVDQIRPKTGPFFASGTPASPAFRHAGRAFIGVGYDHGQQPDGSVTGGSWLQSFASTGSVNPVVAWDYFEDQARVAVVSDFGIALSSASRTSGGLNAIGIATNALANAATYDAWAGYLDAVRMNASAGNAHGLEVNAAAVGSAPARGAATPYDDFSGLSMVIGLALAAGSDAVVFGPSWPISALLEFRNNGASAHTGINFRNNVLLREGTAEAAGAVGSSGYGRAIALPAEYGVSFYSSAAAGDGEHKESVRIYSTVANTDIRQEIVFADGSISFNEKESPGAALFQVMYRADAASNIAVEAGSSGQGAKVTTRGVASDITLTLAPKGNGWVSFGALANCPEYADDTAAAAGGLNIGGIYRTGSALKVRIA